MNQPDDRSEYESRPGEPDLARLVAAVRELERLGGPAAIVALDQAAAALDDAVGRLPASARLCATSPDRERHLAACPTAGPCFEGVESTDGELRGRVRFPVISAEGNRWVDPAASVNAFEAFFVSTVGCHGARSCRPTSVSADFLALTPRNTDLVIQARILSTEGLEIRLAGSIIDGIRVLTRAEGLVVLL